jgi:hypothetical protein
VKKLQKLFGTKESKERKPCANYIMEKYRHARRKSIQSEIAQIAPMNPVIEPQSPSTLNRRSTNAKPDANNIRVVLSISELTTEQTAYRSEIRGKLEHLQKLFRD